MTVGAGQLVDRKVIDHPVVGFLRNKVVRVTGIRYHSGVIYVRGRPDNHHVCKVATGRNELW